MIDPIIHTMVVNFANNIKHSIIINKNYKAFLSAFLNIFFINALSIMVLG
jgi:hypothetical protein